MTKASGTSSPRKKLAARITSRRTRGLSSSASGLMMASGCLRRSRRYVATRLAGDLRGLEQRHALIGEPIDAAVIHLAVRVAQMMLQMPDQRLVPIHEIERPVRRDRDARGAEVRIVGGDEILQRLALQARAFL